MLSPKAIKILSGYFNLPIISQNGVRCPYFNNTRLRRRGQLRVLIGKGTPMEIVEEAKIISTQYHAGLFDKAGHCCLHNEHGHEITAEEIRKFLIDHGLGIDCSGFVTQILHAHFKETKNIDLARKLFKNPKNILRHVINYLRPIENIGVRTYFDDRNTKEIKNISEIQPLDLIIMMETGPQNKRNHIILITAKEGTKIKYAHARAWASEGQYGHGVAEGEIKIIKPEGNLLEQEWIELGKTDDTNGTLLEAKQAKILIVKRIKL